MYTPDQLIASQKANLDALNDLSLKVFDSMEQLTQLNLNTTKAALVDTHEQLQALLSAKDAQELFALQSEMVQPLAQKYVTWGREVYDIVSRTGSEFSKVLESKTEENREQFTTFVENAVRSAPAGSEAATTLIRNAMAAANSTLESMQRAAKQAGDMAKANFNAAAEQAERATKNTVEVAKANTQAAARADKAAKSTASATRSKKS